MKPHSRLFVSGEGFDALRSQVRDDTVSRRLFECLRRKADAFLGAPVCLYQKTGKRLLAVSRCVMERVLHLAMVARLTGDARYARRATEEMLACAAFPDWNPSHFLDAAEATFALAVGYDWLFDQLSVHERAAIAAAILEKGLRPSLDETSLDCHWIKGGNNWNQVCHAGVVVGALALAEHDPDLTDRIVARAVAYVPRAAAAYAPDGAYVEGPMYWAYGTAFHVTLVAALESTLDRDYGLADAPGFLESARYLAQVTGPTGRFFNYCDCRDARGLQESLFWFARRLNEPDLVKWDRQHLDDLLSAYESSHDTDAYRLLTLALVWHRPPSSTADVYPATPLPQHWMGCGLTPVGVHRSAWDDPEAAYAALKGGSPSVSHGQMDAGTFVLEAGGVRWAVDPGLQEYESLEKLGVDLWNNRQDSGRWKVFRLGSQGHNVPNFNGAPQLVTGHAPVVRFHADGDMPHTVVDLSSLYCDHVTRAWRGVGMLPDGSIILQDEWTAGDLPVEMRWQMLTTAEVSVEGRQMLLDQDGVQLRLRVITATEIKTVEVIERSQPAHSFDAPNPGLRMIVITCPTPPRTARTLRLSAALSTVPGNTNPADLPLEQWSPILK